MLLFDEVKKILNKYGHNYLDDEIKIIREFISTLVEIDFNLFKRRMEEEMEKKSELKLIPLKIDYETQSNPLH